jgi:hypothetical protein
MAWNTHVVRIGRDGKPNPSDAVTLSKRADHRILWISESDQAYDICFDKERSPFKKGHTFHIDAGKWVESREIDSNADEGEEKKYHYELRARTKAGTKEVAADPDVIIQK